MKCFACRHSFDAPLPEVAVRGFFLTCANKNPKSTQTKIMPGWFSPHPLWWVCIVVRLLLVAWVKVTYAKTPWNLATVILLGSVSVGFWVKFFTGSNDEVQIRQVFWHSVRWVHASLFTIATIVYLQALYSGRQSCSWVFLLVDVVFSIAYRMSVGM